MRPEPAAGNHRPGRAALGPVTSLIQRDRPSDSLNLSSCMLFGRRTDCPISINPTIIVSLLPTSLLHYPLLSHSHYASRGAVCVRRSPFATWCADWIRGWIHAESIIRESNHHVVRDASLYGVPYKNY